MLGAGVTGCEREICKESDLTNLTVHKIVFSNELSFYLKKKKNNTKEKGILSVLITVVSVLGEEILDLREEESMKG